MTPLGDLANLEENRDPKLHPTTTVTDAIQKISADANVLARRDELENIVGEEFGPLLELALAEPPSLPDAEWPRLEQQRLPYRDLTTTNSAV